GFATAGFADNRQCFAGIERKADIAHRLHDAAAGAYRHAEILHIQHRAHRDESPATPSASRRASPSILNASTVRLMHSAGQNNSAGCSNILRRPSLLIEPHDGVGGVTPMPMNDKKASVKIALGMAKVSATSTTPKTLGSMCRAMM